MHVDINNGMSRILQKAAVQRGARGVFLPPPQVDGTGVGQPLARGSHALAVDPHPLRRPGATGTTSPRAALHRSSLQNTNHILNNGIHLH